MASDQTEYPDRVLCLQEVVKLIGLSPATLWREVRAGRFPQPLLISPRRRGWRLSSVIAWLASRPTSPLP